MSTETVLSQRFEPLPKKMQGLLVDEKGIPVPWFVAWIDGKPEFRAASVRKWKLALSQRLCWVCGGRLGTRFAFVAGPMCGINRTSSEPPCDLECARWSARNCPFLSNPHMVRRQDERYSNQDLRDTAPGISITRNPGVAMVWITREYEMFDDGMGQHLIMMGRPQEVEWYCEGRAATRAEVEESIDNGIAALETLARQEKGALEALERKRRQFDKFLPARR